MAEPTLHDPSTTVGRWTLTELRDYAMFLVGGVWADLDSTEQSILDKLINEAHNLHRHTTRYTKRWAEDETTLTWVDGDDFIALPANFGELIGRHIWRVNSDGQPTAQIEVIPEETWLDGFYTQSEATGDAASRWDGRDIPVARIYRHEDGTLNRVLQLYPRPDADNLFKVVYNREAEKLSSGGDVLEAPVSHNFQVASDAAIEWLLARGDVEKAGAVAARSKDREVLRANARETGRPMRVRTFDEVGYEGSRQGDVGPGLMPDR